MATKKNLTDAEAEKHADDALNLLVKLRGMCRESEKRNTADMDNVALLSWAIKKIEDGQANEQRIEMYSSAIRELTRVYHETHPDSFSTLPDIGKMAAWAAGVMQRVQVEVAMLDDYLDKHDAVELDKKFIKQRFTQMLQGSFERLMPKLVGPRDVLVAAASALGFGQHGLTLVYALAGAQDVERRMREFVAKLGDDLNGNFMRPRQIKEMFDKEFPGGGQ